MNSKMEGEDNLLTKFFVWWYGEALTKFFAYLKKFLAYLADLFSVKICLSTLFAPWKRDQISTQGLSIQDRFQVILMNLMSRLIGCVVKIIVIIVFLIIASIAVLGEAVALVVWVAWPFFAVVFFYLAATSLAGGAS